MGAEVHNLSEDPSPLSTALHFSQGSGVDGVIVTASTKSEEPLLQAAQMSRTRGRIVLVGVTGTTINRTEFFKKELSFQVSCSYGPGRYDEAYEQKGHDYPIGFVRWTEQRNFQAILQLMQEQKLNLKALTTATYDFNQAKQGYQEILQSGQHLGVILRYGHQQTTAAPNQDNEPPTNHPAPNKPVQPTDRVAISLLGPGNYALRSLLPAFKNQDPITLQTVCSAKGLSAAYAKNKFGFNQAVTNTQDAIHDPKANLIVIATRHDSHANLVMQSLNQKKHVFVEKPLCLNLSELEQIKQTAELNPDLKLMVGFNRRFSPLVQKAKSLLQPIAEPKVIQMTINAGHIPEDHWTQDPSQGGRRLIGEGCHFIDLARYLAGHPIKHFQINSALFNSRSSKGREDHFALNLEFQDGSLAQILYTANGHKGYPKERIEVFTQGKVLTIDNFKILKACGFKGFSKKSLWRQDKGQMQMVQALTQSILRGEPNPIPTHQIFEVAQVSIEAAQSLRS